MALPYAGVGNQRKNTGKTVFIEIVLFEGSLKAQRDNPIAIVQREALADINDPFGIVDAQSQRFQNLIHKCTIFGDHALFQPLHDSIVGDIQVEGKNRFAIILHRKDMRLHTGESCVLQGKCQKLFIIKTQAVFIHNRFTPFLQIHSYVFSERT